MQLKRLRLAKKRTKRGTLQLRRCAFCGTPTWRYPDVLGRLKGHYCKHSCYLAWLNNPVQQPLYSGLQSERKKWIRTWIRRHTPGGLQGRKPNVYPETP